MLSVNQVSGCLLCVVYSEDTEGIGMLSVLLSRHWDTQSNTIGDKCITFLLTFNILDYTSILLDQH